MSEVVCLGIFVADCYGKPVDEWPERGRLSLVDEIGIGIGGCAANTGLALCKLGTDVAVMGKVGDDVFGDFVLNTMREHGAKVEGVLRDQTVKTSATLIMIDSSGERTFIHYIGANGCVRPEELDMNIITQSRVYHFAGALVMPGFDGAPAASVMKAAQQAGVITSLDTVWNATVPWAELMAPLFPHTDIFLPSLSEAEQITGYSDPHDVASALMDLGVNIVCLKMGERGSYVRTVDAEVTAPAFKIIAADGTGSGDAYVAGFLHAYLKGWNLEDTARFANATGALCTTGIGTQAGLRDFNGTLEFMAEQDGSRWLDYTEN